MRRKKWRGLKLQLAQQDVAVFQSQFLRRKLNLRGGREGQAGRERKVDGVSRCNFQKQQAQLELLRTAGNWIRYGSEEVIGDS